MTNMSITALVLAPVFPNYHYIYILSQLKQEILAINLSTSSVAPTPMLSTTEMHRPG